MYGVIVTLGIFIAASFVDRVIRLEIREQRAGNIKSKRKKNRVSAVGSQFSEHLWGSLFWALLLGIVGARLYHVYDLWDYYFQNPNLIGAVWTGGMGIFGGFIGGFLGFYLYLKKHKLDVWKWLDYAALGIPLAQAIGRWGNFFNQELYGLPTNLPWAIYIDPEHRLFPVKAFETFHPLFLYESIGSLIIWGALYYLYGIRVNKEKKVTKEFIGVVRNDGSLFALYLVGYGILRSGLEPLRIISWQIYGLRVAQIFSIGFILVGALILKKRMGGRNEKADK